MKNKLKQLLSPTFSRRDFMKSTSAVGGLAAVAGSISLPFKSSPVAAATPHQKKKWSGVHVP